MIKAIKYRFYPTKDQETLLKKTLGCTRFVYNKCLDIKSSLYKTEKKNISGFELMKELTTWKADEDTKFLKDVSNVALQQTIRHLEVAFENFFAKRASYPVFKKRRNGGSFSLTNFGFRIKDKQIYLAKSKYPLNLAEKKWRIKDTDKISSLTIRLTPSNKWYVSLLVKNEEDLSLPKSDKVIGLDMGITSLVTASDGRKFNAPDCRKEYIKLKRLQKEAARKQKNSNNRTKANLKIARIYEKILNKREDNLHKLTTKLVHENQVIVIEDLAVKNMMKNHKLAGSISDASWCKLKQMLNYKCQWYGRELKVIDRFFPSSKTCNECGYILEKLPLNIRSWKCPRCGQEHDRDINAAKNILAAGHVVYVCGGSVRLKDTLVSNAISKETENLNREVGRTQLL